MVVIVNGSGDVTENSGMVTLTPRALLQETDIDQLDPRISYPVVIISCVHYLGPPGPSPSQILETFSRFSEDFLGRERDP